MQTENAAQRIESTGTKLVQIAISCLKLGAIGFGGIAGMVATIENEMVIRRKWIDHQHFIFGIRPATTALVIGMVFRIAGSALKHNKILIFLKIGAVLYGSGYVLFAYMDEALAAFYCLKYSA